MNIFEKIYNQSKFCKKKILLDQNYYYSNFYNLITKYLDFFFKSLHNDAPIRPNPTTRIFFTFMIFFSDILFK